MYIFSFFYGIAAALIALGAQLLLSRIAPLPLLVPLVTGGTPSLITAGILLLAVTEEGAKLIAVLAGMGAPTRFCRNALHAVVVGVGFVLVELALIALTPTATVAAAAAPLGNLIIHISTPLLTVSLIALLRAWSCAGSSALALLVTTLLHAGYNLLIYAGYAPTSLPQILFLGGVLFATLATAIAAHRATTATE